MERKAAAPTHADVAFKLLEFALGHVREPSEEEEERERTWMLFALRQCAAKELEEPSPSDDEQALRAILWLRDGLPAAQREHLDSRIGLVHIISRYLKLPPAAKAAGLSRSKAMDPHSYEAKKWALDIMLQPILRIITK